jgi:threonine dehydrogenase-like Zn-dependent dehydrogenase
MGIRTSTYDLVSMAPSRHWAHLRKRRHGHPVIIGAGGSTPEGMFAEYVVVDRHEVLETPAHLDDVHAAAWPLAATTAWRYAPIGGVGSRCPC